MLEYKIYRGNIKRCTSYKSHNLLETEVCVGERELEADCFGSIDYKAEIIKENAMLVKFDKGGYIDIDNLNTFLDYVKVFKDIYSNGYKLNGLMLAKIPHKERCLFVDNDLELLYDSRKHTEKQSAYRLIKELKK